MMCDRLPQLLDFLADMAGVIVGTRLDLCQIRVAVYARNVDGGVVLPSYSSCGAPVVVKTNSFLPCSLSPPVP